MPSDVQVVEEFHLHFVRLLCAGPSKGTLAIKGGCNLRFFFESVRYSEDIDLDVAGLPVHALKEKVSAVLGGPALSLVLRSRGITVTSVSAQRPPHPAGAVRRIRALPRVGDEAGPSREGAVRLPVPLSYSCAPLRRVARARAATRIPPQRSTRVGRTDPVASFPHDREARAGRGAGAQMTPRAR